MSFSGIFSVTYRLLFNCRLRSLLGIVITTLDNLKNTTNSQHQNACEDHPSHSSKHLCRPRRPVTSPRHQQPEIARSSRGRRFTCYNRSPETQIRTGCCGAHTEAMWTELSKSEELIGVIVAKSVWTDGSTFWALVLWSGGKGG